MVARAKDRIWTLAVLVPVLSGSQFARQDNDDDRKGRTLSADKNVLACAVLLALLRGQDSIFFF